MPSDEKTLKSAAYAIKRLGLEGRSGRFYDLVRTGTIPPGVAVKLGRAVMVDAEKLEAFICSGGKALPGGWRREAR